MRIEDPRLLHLPSKIPEPHLSLDLCVEQASHRLLIRGIDFDRDHLTVDEYPQLRADNPEVAAHIRRLNYAAHRDQLAVADPLGLVLHSGRAGAEASFP